MKKLILLFLLSLMTIIWGCNPNGSVTAPDSSNIFTDPESYVFSDWSSGNVDQQKVLINVIVRDLNGDPQSGQELFFFCHLCDTGIVEIHDNAGNLINVNSGSVHGITGDAGNYFLWVYFYSGGYLEYQTDIRITSGTNDAYVPLTVDNDLG